MTESIQINKTAGTMAGIISSILAIIGILFFGIVFVPLALIVALIGMSLAVKSTNIAGIGVNILAFILVIIGFFTSPVLLTAIGSIFAVASH